MTSPFATLEDFLNHGAEFAADAFKAQGEVHPMWLCETKANELMVIAGEMPESGNKRNIMLLAMRKLFRQHGVVRYVFMTEAWSLEMEGKSRDDMPASIKAGASIASHPERREIIMLTAEDATHQRMGTYFILRPEHGKASLSEFKLWDEGKLEGRMTGLLGAQP